MTDTPTLNPLAAAVAPVAESIVAAAVKTFTGPPASTPSWYAIKKAADTGEVEIMIYDVIGAFGITAKDFVTDLKAIDAKRIRLCLNTPGGELFDATAIYNALKKHPAQIVAQVDGLAASAGSVIAMAADEVRMASNSYIMIHEASGGAYGPAEDHIRYAGMLEKANDNVAQAYQDKAGKKKEHWRDLMRAETWFTAEEAKAEGLADTIDKVEKAEPSRAAASADFKIYNQAKIPDAVRRLWNITPAAAATPPAVTEPTQPTTPEATPATASKVTAPEVPPLGAPHPGIPERNDPMGDAPTTSAPAQTPAAGTSGNQQGAGEIVQFNQQAIQSYITKGRQLGHTEGVAAEQVRMKTLMAAVPTRPDLVIQAFVANQEASTIAMIAKAEADAEVRASAKTNELRVQNARLEAMLATGGHPGVAFAPGSPADGIPSVPSGLEPEQQAKMEWDSDPMLRAQHGNNEKRFLLYRVNHLKGNVRVLKTA